MRELEPEDSAARPLTVVSQESGADAPQDTVQQSSGAMPAFGTAQTHLADGHLSLARGRSSAGLRSQPTILALSASHDAAACILRDGVIRAAVPLERLTRIKHDGTSFLSSEQAARYCMKALGLDTSHIDYFAFNAQPLLPGWIGLGQPVADAGFTLFDPYSPQSLHVSHHLAHAYAAFGASRFESATVLVCDGSGGSVVGADDHVLFGPALRDYLKTALKLRPQHHVASAYHFDRKGGYRLLWRETAPTFNVRCGSSSLGEMYAAVANYVFGSWQASGKLMGLAPYGDADAYGPSLLVRDEQQRLQFRADWKLREARAVAPGDPMNYRNLAARIQADFEVAMLERAHAAIRENAQEPLVLSGGLALNCRANQRIAESLGVGRTFFFPASHDSGIAIGAALAAHAALTGSLPDDPWRNDFLGHDWSVDDIETAIRQRSSRLHRRAFSVEAVVDALAGGEAMGWFEGGSEFGPRALGHRSILADPRSRSMWDRINADVKYREDFRPFAPVVPIEHAARFFEISEPSPFMLRVVRIRQEYRQVLGAVCHVDGSARVQTVDRDTLPRLHQLLMSFGERTGVPVLLNTSLNRRGEPLVETPLEAIDLLLATGLDALVMGEALLRAPRPASTGLEPDDYLLLAPGVVAVTRLTGEGRTLVLEDASRGVRALPQWFSEVVERLARGETVQELVRASPEEPGPAAIRALLTALCRESFLNIAV